MPDLSVHPYADRFPMLPADELQALADDIAANGQLHPITLWIDPETGEEMLLDGRNRLAACELVGVDPRAETHEGDPYAFIVSANTHRRNLNAGQVAMARAIALAEQGQRENGRWKRGTFDSDLEVNSNSTSMYRAGFIIDNDPEAADLVFAGDALASVYESVKDTAEARAEQRHQSAELRKVAPDLARKVDEDGMAFETAWGMYEKRLSAAEAKAKEKHEADLRRWRSNAEAIRSLSGISSDTWMDGYKPDEMGALAQYLTTDRLLAAREQLDSLIDWSKQR